MYGPFSVWWRDSPFIEFGEYFSRKYDNQIGNVGLFGNMHRNVVSVSAEISNNVMNSVSTSDPSIGASSMVTDANSGLSGGGPHFQRSGSFNTESNTGLPSSPLSITSNSLSISGSTVIDSPSAVQQSSNNDYVSHLRKKPRLDVKQEDMMQQPIVQQILHRQNSILLQNPNPNPQLQALIQQQRLRQQQQLQLLQSLPPAQRAHLIQQQQQLQLRQLQQQGLCYQRQRPADNSIAYWRKFLAEYYSPRAKKRIHGSATFVSQNLGEDLRQLLKYCLDSTKSNSAVTLLMSFCFWICLGRVDFLLE